MSNEQYIDDQPYMDLPPVQPPKPEGQPSHADQEVVKQQGSDRNPELFPQQPGQQPPSQQTPSSQPVTTAASSGNDQGDTTAHQHTTPVQIPQIADDVDLIEKEWVEKAQEIIKRTKDDPHTQSKELGQVKTEYLKRRFDKPQVDSKEAKWPRCYSY